MVRPVERHRRGVTVVTRIERHGRAHHPGQIDSDRLGWLVLSRHDEQAAPIRGRRRGRVRQLPVPEPERERGIGDAGRIHGPRPVRGHGDPLGPVRVRRRPPRDKPLAVEDHERIAVLPLGLFPVRYRDARRIEHLPRGRHARPIKRVKPRARDLPPVVPNDQEPRAIPPHRRLALPVRVRRDERRRRVEKLPAGPIRLPTTVYFVASVHNIIAFVPSKPKAGFDGVPRRHGRACLREGDDARAEPREMDIGPRRLPGFEDRPRRQRACAVGTERHSRDLPCAAGGAAAMAIPAGSSTAPCGVTRFTMTSSAPLGRRWPNPMTNCAPSKCAAGRLAIPPGGASGRPAGSRTVRSAATRAARPSAPSAATTRQPALPHSIFRESPPASDRSVTPPASRTLPEGVTRAPPTPVPVFAHTTMKFVPSNCDLGLGVQRAAIKELPSTAPEDGAGPL